MAQAALPFAPSVLALAAPASRAGRSLPARGDAGAAAAAEDGVGFQIGWDHARHHLTPPLAHLQAESPVRQGWQAGRAAFGQRTLKAGVAVRQWLALRLQAWQHGDVFEDVQLTPAFLARLDATHCPVTRQPLLLASGGAQDLQLQRLNPQAAYAAGNLAAISRQAAQARQQQGRELPFAELLRLAGRTAEPAASAALAAAPAHAAAQAIHLPASPVPSACPANEPLQPAATVRGLDAAAWLRLAVLSSFATPLPHALAATLPLCVLPPNRCRVINPVQAVQVMLTLQFTQGGYARRLLTLAALMPSSDARQAFQIFMHTLLSRRLSAGQDLGPEAVRQAMEDSWADPLVQRRWQRLALRLTEADCERLLQRAHQRGLCVGGGRWVSSAQATDGWALPVGNSRPTAGRQR